MNGIDGFLNGIDEFCLKRAARERGVSCTRLEIEGTIAERDGVSTDYGLRARR